MASIFATPLAIISQRKTKLGTNRADKISPRLRPKRGKIQGKPDKCPAWTKESVLPGGAIEGDRDDYAARLRRRYPFLTESLARHYARTYGSNSELLLGNAGAISDLGENFGHEFYEAELKYLVDHEWVRRADDALWRRTKQGMWLNADQQSRVSQWLMEYTQQRLSLAS